MTAAAQQREIAILVTNRTARQQSASPLAADPGVVLTAKLIASFRLGKLLTLLPITREVLGNETFASEVELFWESTPPTSFYLPDEAIAFCDHLTRRIDAGLLEVRHLARAVALERGDIAVRRAAAVGDAADGDHGEERQKQ